MGSNAHIAVYEQGGCASLGGVFPRILPNLPDGTLDLKEVEKLCSREDDIHYPVLRLVCIENTHNNLGGVPVSAEWTDSIGALASKFGIPLHIDGARILNAAAALGVTPARLALAAASVSVCLSKGVGAPVGTVLVGPTDFIRKARRLRKALGGGMRQAGCIAAAALVGVRTIAPRLGDDHARCRALAAGLAALPGVSLRDGVPRSNIAFFVLHPSIDWDVLQAGLRARGIAANGGPGLVRLVTHHGVSDAGVEATIAAWRDIVTPMMLAAGMDKAGQAA